MPKRSRRSSGLSFAMVCAVLAAFLHACTPPEACLQYLGQPGPLSYEKVVLEQKVPFASWQTRLRDKLQEELGLRPFLQDPKLLNYRVGAANTFKDGAQTFVRTDVKIDSLLDGARIPACFIRLDGLPEAAPKKLVLLIHGHRSTAEDALRRDSLLHAAALTLAKAGFLVIVPEVRSFGDYLIGGKGHKAYVRSKAEGEFMKEALADAYSCVRFAREYFPNHDRLAVVGHSLGGHVALHLGASVASIDHVAVSGIYVPYSCINTAYHHECQWVKSVAGNAEMSDVAGLVAPRKLLIHFGEKERFYTPAVTGLMARTLKAFEGSGRADALQLTISPGLKHELDPDAVLRFLRD